MNPQSNHFVFFFKCSQPVPPMRTRRMPGGTIVSCFRSCPLVFVCACACACVCVGFLRNLQHLVFSKRFVYLFSFCLFFFSLVRFERKKKYYDIYFLPKQRCRHHSFPSRSSRAESEVNRYRMTSISDRHSPSTESSSDSRRRFSGQLDNRKCLALKS